MDHSCSRDDELFASRFEACELPPPFTHRDHVRLAYVHLTRLDVASAHSAIERVLRGYLRHHDVDPGKYHETLTLAWLMAVRHFMEICSPTESAAEFLSRKPRLLDSGIMLKHYSPDRLYSEAARLSFVEPDRLPIPRYAS